MSELQGVRSPPSCVGIEARTRSLIVVDRRPLVGGSLCHWLRVVVPELNPIWVATIDAVGSDILNQISTVIFGTSAQAPAEDEWLSNEVACTRTRRREAPLVLLGDAPDLRLAEEAVRQLHLSGYIPTSSSLELASTALRLVIAGGRYFPEKCLDADKATPTTSQAPASSAHYAKLTTREAAVLELLEQGLPNKIIANRLRMSQNTVKAHVHNIIAKLNVRNRTEAAVARYAAWTAPIGLRGDEAAAGDAG